MSSNDSHESYPEPIIVYKECLKKHKGTCVEFFTTAEPSSLEMVWCICGCHVKDHRLVELPPPPITTPSSSRVADASTVHSPLQLSLSLSPIQTQPITDKHHAGYSAAVSVSDVVEVGGKEIKKRRPRTMFSAYRKEKLREYAEKVRWTVQKKDKEDRIRFCEEIGITPRSCKNWITNNRKQLHNNNHKPSTKLCL